MSNANLQDFIVWLDYETDGLEPNGGNLLEVAAFVTDTELNILDEGYHAIIKYDASQAYSMRAAAEPVVQAMHDTNDLWGKLPYGTPLPQVESELLAYIKSHAPEPQQARLGGSSISFDQKWSQVHMPSVYDHLHYRVVDVSTLQAVADWWGLDYLLTSTRESTHEARADIIRSINLAKSLKAAIPKGTPNIKYLGIGHPAWRDPLVLSGREDAVRWMKEVGDSGHPISVAKITAYREDYASIESLDNGGNSVV